MSWHDWRHIFACHAADLLESGWNPEEAELGDTEAVPEAFQALLRWSYTGRLAVPAHACAACQALGAPSGLVVALSAAAGMVSHIGVTSV